jgi:plastocyanin
MDKRVAVAGALLGLAVGLAACGDDGSETATRDEGCGEDEAPDDVVAVDGTEANVRAQDNTFVEENISVAAGTTVVWDNVGRQDHDVIAVKDDCDWGVPVEDFAPEASYEHTFDEPGTYRYYCSLHGTADAGMVGTVVVD